MIGEGAAGIVRPYGRNTDRADTVLGFSYSINSIKYFQRPEFNRSLWLDQSVEDIVANHSHLFTQFAKSDLPTSPLVIKTFKMQPMTSFSVMGFLLLFDRFKDNMDATLLPTTPQGHCPCMAFSKDGTFKGMLMRRLEEPTMRHMREIQSYSTEAKSLVFSQVWKFVDTLLIPTSRDKCLRHGDIKALSDTTAILSGNVMYDPNARKIIVVDYDPINIADTSTDDVKVCMDLFKTFATQVKLDISMPKQSSISMQSNLDLAQMDIFLNVSCINSVLSIMHALEFKDDYDAALGIDHRWLRLLRMLVRNISGDSGCGHVNPVFDKSSVKHLEIYVGERMVRKIEIRLIDDCRLMMVALLLYFKIFNKVFNQTALSQTFPNTNSRHNLDYDCLSLFCDPHTSNIRIKYRQNEVTYSKTGAVIEVLLMCLDSNSLQ